MYLGVSSMYLGLPDVSRCIGCTYIQLVYQLVYQVADLVGKQHIVAVVIATLDSESDHITDEDQRSDEEESIN